MSYLRTSIYWVLPLPSPPSNSGNEGLWDPLPKNIRILVVTTYWAGGQPKLYIFYRHESPKSISMISSNKKKPKNQTLSQLVWASQIPLRYVPSPKDDVVKVNSPAPMMSWSWKCKGNSQPGQPACHRFIFIQRHPTAVYVPGTFSVFLTVFQEGFLSRTNPRKSQSSQSCRH